MYIEYLEAKHKYLNAQREYNKILDEKEKLFAQTQPSATRFEGEKVDGGSFKNSWDNYLTQSEEKNIDPRLSEAKSIMQSRKFILDATEKQLRESKETDDRIYVYRFLEKKKVYQITGLVNYSERHVINYLNKIKENISREK